MTATPYMDDSTARTFTAAVERVLDDRIVLDRTLFYPTGGGQPHDVGTVAFDGGRADVVDVRKKDEIYHTLEGPVPAEGDEVTGEIDWDRRYAHMRYHTAQHLLSAILLDEYDAPTTGNQLYHDRARIDVGYDRFTEADFERIEAAMDRAIEDAHPVDWYTLDRETAEAQLDPQRTRLHLLPESITEVRIVEIEGIDRTACAGTHVSNTAEIGAFTITGRETKGSDEERLAFVLD